MRFFACAAAALIVVAVSGCATQPGSGVAGRYDLVIRNGTVYDGSGGEPVKADIGIRGDRIATIGDLSTASARRKIDATGMAVAPGFINVLSWAPDALIADGRGVSDSVQGVTLEIFGEGWSYGPLNADMKKEVLDQQGDIKYPVNWTTLGEFMQMLEKRGISPNIASFVGASTVRQFVVGNANRAPTAPELAQMQEQVRIAMQEG
ncbi:MAG: D-aminoacylase, partial [Rhodanobacteraceae bacterium]